MKLNTISVETIKQNISISLIFLFLLISLNTSYPIKNHDQFHPNKQTEKLRLLIYLADHLFTRMRRAQLTL